MSEKCLACTEGAKAHHPQHIKSLRLDDKGVSRKGSIQLAEQHEPPVMVEPIMILEEGRDVVTVCKPSSVPVHPCGQYRKNTVVGILQAEHGIAPLFQQRNSRVHLDFITLSVSNTSTR
eukprot:Gb_25971 [translate_table: standard]